VMHLVRGKRSWVSATAIAYCFWFAPPDQSTVVFAADVKGPSAENAYHAPGAGRLSKKGWVTIDDSEASQFLSPANIQAAATEACGLNSIVFEDQGPTLVFGTSETAANVYSRALYAWCRAHGTDAKKAYDLKVRFLRDGDLIRKVEMELQDRSENKAVIESISDFRPIQSLYNAAKKISSAFGDVKKGKHKDDLFWLICNKITLNDDNYFPKTELQPYGEGANLVMRGDQKRLYAWAANTENCSVFDACEKRPLVQKPLLWLGIGFNENVFPRPGVGLSEEVGLGVWGQWVRNAEGQPLLRPFEIELRKVRGAPCQEEPRVVYSTPKLENEVKNGIAPPITNHLRNWKDLSSCPGYRVSELSAAPSGLVLYSGYLVRLNSPGEREVFLSVSQIFVPDGRVFSTATVKTPNSDTVGLSLTCTSSILN